MAPLPPENTGRLFCDYVANGHEHTVMFRFGGAGQPTATFLDFVVDVFDTVAPFMPTDWEFLQARVAIAGSTLAMPNIFNPGVLAGTVTPAPAEAPAFISFVGRSGTGRRGRLFFLGAGLSPAGEGGTGADYRLTAAESTAVATVLGILDVADFLAIDGNAIVWNRYANLGYHAYWQKAVRG